ncbi:MAG: hypothetical protein ACLRMZ_04450 [Blautia marasmi]
MYINEFLDAYLRSPVTIIGGADGPTSVFVAYNSVPKLGMDDVRRFALGCIDVYLSMKKAGKNRSGITGDRFSLGIIGRDLDHWFLG